MKQLVLSVCFLVTALVAQADEAGQDLAARIDPSIEERLEEESIEPNPVIGDAAFARRVTLDLAGRIPTVSELNEFLGSDAPDQREAYVDRLLDSVDFAYHLRNELDLMLLARHKKDDGWRDYLLTAARENRSWDRIFREIMLPERESPDDKRPAAFLHARAKDLDSMTNDTSALLFGINISCAKCHDHPLVADWEQRHYFGLASFFQRTYPTKKGFVAEKFDGRLKFNTTDGEEKQAPFMFLTSALVSEPEAEQNEEAKQKIQQQIRDAEKKDDAPAPPLPDFSPRAELVRLALEPHEVDFFSRNMVNRTWARLLGRGLVEPLDQMHTENEASHPALLELLAQNFATNGFDLRHLVRSIVLSRTYARDSRWSGNGEPPGEEFFARGIVRPLTAWQLSLSLNMATRNPDRITGLTSAAEWPEQRTSLEQKAAAFANLLPVPSESFRVGSEEALLFSNSETFDREFLQDSNEQLVGHLGQLSEDESLINLAFLAVVSRPPSDTERGAISLHLAQRADQRPAALKHVVWALLASPEFRFNH
jgi:hypothetical protein